MEKIRVIKVDKEIIDYHCDMCECVISSGDESEVGVEFGTTCVCGKLICQRCVGNKCILIGRDCIGANYVCPDCRDFIGRKLIEDFNVAFERWDKFDMKIFAKKEQIRNRVKEIGGE